MISFSTIKLFAGAVALRALETYRLLFIRFLPLTAILIILNTMFANDIIHYGSLLILTSVILLLSRSSMVRKDWHYVFMSNKTTIMLIANLFFIVYCCILYFIYKTYVNYTYSTSTDPVTLLIALFIPGLMFICYVPPLITMYTYAMLDSDFSNKKFLSQSVHQVNLLTWKKPQLMALFTFMSLLIGLPLFGILIPHLIGLIFYFIPTYLTIELQSFLSLLLYMPWHAAFVAVIYEEMRYRSGI